MKTLLLLTPVWGRASWFRLVCLLALAQIVSAGEPFRSPRLDGTFMQLLEQHGRWTPQQWSQLFDCFRSIGMHRLILQWSVLDGSAFYSSQAFRSVQNATLPNVLSLADSADMRVLVGLVHDSDYWTRIQGNPGSIGTYLRRLRARSMAAATELAPLLKQHSSFQGWYLPEEIDDINWRARDARNVLFDHVSALTQELRRLTPSATVAISAFSQAQSSPQAFAAFWDEFFRRASVDAVLFQDGIGVNKLELSEVPVYLKAVRRAAEKNARAVEVVVELMRQASGPPLDSAPFSAVPGPLDRILRQIEIAAQYSSGGIIGFSVPEYMTPLGGQAANELFSRYRLLIRGNAGHNP